jgi:hypothetical protein
MRWQKRRKFLLDAYSGGELIKKVRQLMSRISTFKCKRCGFLAHRVVKFHYDPDAVPCDPCIDRVGAMASPEDGLKDGPCASGIPFMSYVIVCDCGEPTAMDEQDYHHTATYGLLWCRACQTNRNIWHSCFVPDAYAWVDDGDQVLGTRV